MSPPNVCFRLNQREGKKLGTTACHSGVTIDVPTTFNISADYDPLVCKGQYCGPSMTDQTYTSFFIIYQIIQNRPQM